jgi:hypothetical protein
MSYAGVSERANEESCATEHNGKRIGTHLSSKETQAQMEEYLKSYCHSLENELCSDESKERNQQSATKPTQKATAARKRT